MKEIYVKLVKETACMLLSELYSKPLGDDRYLIEVQLYYKFHKETKQFEAIVKKGEKPNNGDLIKKFKEKFDVDTQLLSLDPWEFKVIDQQPDKILKIKVIKRTFDPTYQRIIR